MDSRPDIPPIRIKHAGVRLAIAAALFPYVLIVPVGVIGIAAAGGWCGVSAFATALALIAASIYTGIILSATAIVLIVQGRREAGAPSIVRRKLLAICLAGSVVPALLAFASAMTPAGPCADGRRIPIASIPVASIDASRCALSDPRSDRHPACPAPCSFSR